MQRLLSAEKAGDTVKTKLISNTIRKTAGIDEQGRERSEREPRPDATACVRQAMN
jgi:hypothetical protein